MQVAAPYTPNSRWKDIPDEYNLTWGENSNAQKLIDFCEEIPEKRINVYFKDKDIDINAINKAKEINKNVFVRLKIDDMKDIGTLKENNIQFFFDYTYPAYSYNVFATMIAMGVSDIYLADDLWYNIVKVKQRCDKENIRIRCVLNIIQSTAANPGEDPRNHFFSPRDINYLEEYIDVGEFNCGDGYYNWNIFNVLYNNYYIRKEWVGTLSDLIPELKLRYPVYSSIPNGIERKLRCRRECELNNRCTHCETLLELAQAFYKKGYKISLKNEEEMGQEE